MKHILTAPAEDFDRIIIDHQFLDGTRALLRHGVEPSSADCFYVDILALEADFAHKYDFQFISKTPAEGTVFLTPI